MAASEMDVDVCIYLCVRLFWIFFKDTVIGDQLPSTLQWVKSTVPRQYTIGSWKRCVEMLRILWRFGNLVVQGLQQEQAKAEAVSLVKAC